jgi:hypothetical protein
LLRAKLVGRGVGTLVLNVCYANKQFQPIKQELAEDLQNELNMLQSTSRDNEVAVVTLWIFKGINLIMQVKGREGSGVGSSSHRS